MIHDIESTVYKIISSITPLSIIMGSGFGILMSFLAPLWGFVIITLFLVIGDLITGTLAAKRRKDKITSKGIMRTIYKFLVYMIVLLASAGVEKVFGGNIGLIHDYQPITWIVAGTIALREVTSVFENAESYTGAPLTSKIELFDKLFKSK